MARRVEAVHRDHPEVPAGLADHLQAMHQDLLAHMHKEEAVLFPMLQSGASAYAGPPLAMTRMEHVDHGQALERLNALSRDAAPPAGACNTWRALHAGIAQRGEDLIAHIHPEHNALLPMFEEAPAPPA